MEEFRTKNTRAMNIVVKKRVWGTSGGLGNNWGGVPYRIFLEGGRREGEAQGGGKGRPRTSTQK